VAPQKSVTYVVTARGPAGISTQNLELIVSVIPKPVGTAPTIVFEANPPVITSGQETVLSWEAQNAQIVRIDPDVGTVALSGTRKVSPSQSVEYSATATGPEGTRTARVRVVVEPAPPAAPTLTLTAEPPVIQAGQEVLLQWKAQNAFNVRIEPDLGVLPLTGTVKVKPTKSVTYFATATGPGGARADATAHITVESRSLLAPTINLQAKPEVIEAGQKTLIEWQAQYASTVRIEPGIGDFAATGSVQISPTKSVTLVATATGPGGKASAKVHITVEPRRPSLKGAGGYGSEKRSGSGTIVWTGQVNKDEPIIIEGSTANIGIVQGSLPGVPCRIQVSDPGVAVVEGPGPSNGFRRVVLRYNRRGSFSLKINWEVLN
jgi:hypothetical protein